MKFPLVAVSEPKVLWKGDEHDWNRSVHEGHPGAAGTGPVFLKMAFYCYII